MCFVVVVLVTVLDSDAGAVKAGGGSGGLTRLDRRELPFLLPLRGASPVLVLASSGEPNGFPRGVTGGRTDGGLGALADKGARPEETDSANGLPAELRRLLGKGALVELRRLLGKGAVESGDGPKGFPPLALLSLLVSTEL